MWPKRRAARWGLASVLSLGGLVLAGLGTLCVTSGCSSIDYLGQSASGHIRLLAAARPVKDAIADPATPKALRKRLELTQRMRQFAVTELHEPDNDSYRSYADLKRPAAVWNVVAAPELSLQLTTWCFPVVGCVGYRGYYDLASANEAAAPLKAGGLEVDVYEVPAYSTLGWMNWIGGDPLLNTFVQWPEGELSRLIFHELAHQVAYAPGDTTFNESFATAVEHIGSQRWLDENATPEVRAKQALTESRRDDFHVLVRAWRAKLDAMYRSDLPDAEKRVRKAEMYAGMRADYEALKQGRWAGYNGYDHWFAKANNASMGTQGAYDDEVGAFERLFAAEGRDFDRFYAEVRRMAALPRPERDAAMAPYRVAPQRAPVVAPATAASAPTVSG
ncbi:aminopeptidase [Scleromatobacter humisilvae]|uniref:aminopeptidase n=1 Tax=Scleromatobacter humisilvae TaxID=2897159 RepID=UPI003B847093